MSNDMKQPMNRNESNAHTMPNLSKSTMAIPYDKNNN